MSGRRTGSRSLFRQGMNLDIRKGWIGQQWVIESRSLFRQGMNLDRRPFKSLRLKDLGRKNLKPLFSRTNVHRFRGVKIDKIMPQILSTYKLATYLKPPPIFPVFGGFKSPLPGPPSARLGEQSAQFCYTLSQGLNPPDCQIPSRRDFVPLSQIPGTARQGTPLPGQNLSFKASLLPKTNPSTPCRLPFHYIKSATNSKPPDGFFWTVLGNERQCPRILPACRAKRNPSEFL